MTLSLPSHSASHRTRAERRVDELAAELRALRAVVNPTTEQRRRLQTVEGALPAAWRVVRDMREGRR